MRNNKSGQKRSAGPETLLAAERHRKILEQLQAERTVRVNQLADLLAVAPETVRRDLEKLESQGRLVRQHGGASLPDSQSLDFPFQERRLRLVEEKKRIAAAALRHVQEGDTLLVDGSTTLLHFARMLPDVRLTVITNSYHVLAELVPKQKVAPVLLGGMLHRESMCFVGPATQKQLAGYHVEKVFMSCRSVSLRQGAADAYEIHAAVKEAMLRHAERRFLLVDHGKFDRKSLIHIAPLGEFDEIITDSGMDEPLKGRYEPVCNQLVVV